MDLICLSTLLQELLVKNKRVALPGIGTFVLEDISSVFLLDGKTITPPTKKVFFYTSEIKNDGLLENIYAVENKISLEVGREAVLLLMEKIEQILIGNKRVDIPGFGYISFEDSCNFYFTVDKNFNVCPDSYPLELISLKPERKLSSVISVIVDEDNESNKVVDVDTTNSESVVEEPKEFGTIKKTKINKWVIITTVLLLVLIVAIVCIYVFKEELRPVLEKLLYTKEELLILKQFENI